MRRRLPLFADKRASERTAQRIEELLSSGGVLTPDLQRWLERLPDKQRNRMVQWGIIDNLRTASNLGKRLKSHVEDYFEFLLAKANTPGHCKWARGTLNRIFSACGFRYFGDIDANVVASHLKECRDRGLGQGTTNSYLKAAKAFCRWAIKTNRTIGPSPLDCLDPVTQTEVRRQRRALEVAELRKLLETTRIGPERYGMSGSERYCLYRLAIETGLRANELRTLTVGSFDLTAGTVTVSAVNTKARRDDLLPVRPDTCLLLGRLFAGKLPAVKAFGGRYVRLTNRTSLMLRADLADAGIKYYKDGEYFDFHSLRHETASLLASTGADVKTAQSLMRHRDVRLTMNVYSHVLGDAEAQAVGRLPDLGDIGDLSSACQISGQARTPLDSNGQSIDDNEQKTAIPA